MYNRNDRTWLNALSECARATCKPTVNQTGAIIPHTQQMYVYTICGIQTNDIVTETGLDILNVSIFTPYLWGRCTLHTSVFVCLALYKTCGRRTALDVLAAYDWCIIYVNMIWEQLLVGGHHCVNHLVKPLGRTWILSLRIDTLNLWIGPFDSWY